jgi:hypothetical protein
MEGEAAAEETFRLADRSRRLFVPGRASRLGHPGHLLFEFAVGRRARCRRSRFAAISSRHDDHRAFCRNISEPHERRPQAAHHLH